MSQLFYKVIISYKYIISIKFIYFKNRMIAPNFD